MRVMNKIAEIEAKEQRRTWLELIRSLLIALMLGVFVLYIAAAAVSMHSPLEYEGTSFCEPISDIPLLSEQEKEWARQTGVASYHIGRDVYVDYSLDDSWWSE